MIAAFVFCLTGCSSSAAKSDQHSSAGQLSGKLVLTGSSTVAPLVMEIGKRFESLHPQVRIDVQTGGSTRGIADARSGLADVGMCSRALRREERDLTERLLARDGICVIVHKTNPAAALTSEQIQAIYRGEISNWNQVGGTDAEICVISKAEGRSTLELFLRHFDLAIDEIQPDVIIGDNAEGVHAVAGNPAAIGYVSLGAAAFDAEQGTAIKLLPLGGVAPSAENVHNGSYPFSRKLNLLVRGEPVGLAKAFLDFAASSQVHDLVTRLHYVPLAE
ncbi:MAG: phosphate ABC transporter substrate-binding protein [Planctomycetales bacterium]